MLSLLGLAAVSSLSSVLAASPAQIAQANTETFFPSSYEWQEGYFKQDMPPENQEFDDPNYGWQHNLGLNSHDTWDKFTSTILDLNAQAPAGVAYKVIFVQRHGLGWHNVASDFYNSVDPCGNMGAKDEPLSEWATYWSRQVGNGTNEWFDALLAPKGLQQTQQVANAGMAEALSNGFPMPQTFLSSPMSRSASTLNNTWWGLREETPDRVPTFKEQLRETMGPQTSEHRREASYLAATYPYNFEDGFAEDDPYSSAMENESHEQQALRTRRMVDEIFSYNPDVFIWITAHSGTVYAFQDFLGLPQPGMPSAPAGVQAFVIKAERNSPSSSTTCPGSSSSSPACPASIANPEGLATTAPLSGVGIPTDPAASAIATTTSTPVLPPLSIAGCEWRRVHSILRCTAAHDADSYGEPTPQPGPSASQKHHHQEQRAKRSMRAMAERAVALPTPTPFPTPTA